MFLILYLQKLGFRFLEAFIITLLGVITACFADPNCPCQPRARTLDPRLCPDHRDRAQPEMLYLAMGILGATVMPH